MDVGIIEHVEESKCISSIVVEDKKATGEVIICVDLRKLNDACFPDSFLTPFTDVVLESVKKIMDLLHEFQDLLPTKFSEMKGNVGDLGEMKIPLNPNTKPIKQ